MAIATIVARVLTVFLGAVPASVLSLWALLGILVGALAVVEGVVMGAVLVIWGLAGIYGTVALWAVAFGCDEPSCFWGLAVGIAAILPLAMSVDPDRLLLGGEINLFAVSSLAVLFTGVAWLLAFVVRHDFHELFAFEQRTRR